LGVSKIDPIESALNALGDLRLAAPNGKVEKQLRDYLAHRSNLVVAKAAKIIVELQVKGATPELVAAFDRLMRDPAKLDKRCAALTEVVTALYQLDYLEPEVYLRGLRHVQKEASFGPPVDAAAKLRGISAQGLLRTSYRPALQDVVPLLVDAEPATRLGVVRALGVNGGDAGLLLLRLKVLTGDDDPEVLGECFSALLSATPEQALPFVAAFVDNEEETTAEAAIWAIGESRSQAGFEVLKEKWERTVEESLRKVLLAAMAASRLPQALDFLSSLVRSANVRTTADVVSALAPYAASEPIREAVRSAVEERGQAALLQMFEEHFRK
jgi:hypothetical protein